MIGSGELRAFSIKAYEKPMQQAMDGYTNVCARLRSKRTSVFVSLKKSLCFVLSS